MLILYEKFYHRTMLAILGIVAVIIVLTFRHYGITWDEELQSQYGLAIVDYYTSFFADRRFAEIYNLYLYGGMFDGLASAIDRFTPFSVYETRHLVNALFGLLGLWGVWRLGKFFGGGAAGLVALILLVLTPMYYGHMFNNPKDIPFAVGIVWTLVYMARSLRELPRIRWPTLVKLGGIMGFTLGVRVEGVMALFFWIAVVGTRTIWPLLKRHDIDSWEAVGLELWRIGTRLVLPVLVISYLVMLACWPWAQQNPIMNPYNAFNEFRHFPHDVEVLLDGKIYMSTELPRFYVPLYFAVQLPELLLLLLAASIPFASLILRNLDAPQKQALGLVLLMGFVPILYTVVAHPALYDAVRHFLFAVPIICVIAALSARSILHWVVGHFRKKWARATVAWGLFTVFGICMLTQLGIMIALHPYEYIYINRSAGGVGGAFGHYELDYWGSSFKEAAKQLQAYIKKTGGVPSGKIYRVAICGPWDSAMIYLPPDYEPVVASEPAEFFLSTTRWKCENMRPGKEVIRIERLGAPLAVVKDLRGRTP